MRHVLLHTARALLPLAVVLSAACGSSGSMNTSAEAGADAAAVEGAIMLRVLNTHTSGEDMTIFLAPEVGEQRIIGTVAGNATLNAPLSGARGRYRFVGQRQNGERITSPYFNAQVAGVYSWDLALNRVNRADR